MDMEGVHGPGRSSVPQEDMDFHIIRGITRKSQGGNRVHLASEVQHPGDVSHNMGVGGLSFEILQEKLPQDVPAPGMPLQGQ